MYIFVCPALVCRDTSLRVWLMDSLVSQAKISAVHSFSLSSSLGEKESGEGADKRMTETRVRLFGAASKQVTIMIIIIKYNSKGPCHGYIHKGHWL